MPEKKLTYSEHISKETIEEYKELNKRCDEALKKIRQRRNVKQETRQR